MASEIPKNLRGLPLNFCWILADPDFSRFHHFFANIWMNAKCPHLQPQIPITLDDFKVTIYRSGSCSPETTKWPPRE